MDPLLIVFAAFGLFFAGVIKGSTGLGYSSCALPFLAAAVGLKMAIVLVVIPAMISNIAVMWNAGHFREMIARFWPFYLASLVGIWVGIQALVAIDQRIAELVLGLLIVAYVIFALLRPAITIPTALQNPLQIPLGALNGILTGLTGSQVLPLVPYMMSLRLDPDRMVQAVNIAVTLAAGFMTVALMQAGLMTMPGFGMSITAIVPAMAGIVLGTSLRRYLPDAHFRQIVLGVLAALGVMLMIR